MASGPAHAEVDAPGAGDEHAAVAIGAQRLALVEVHDRCVGARPAESDAAERELALLRLPVGHQRAGLAGHLDVGGQPEHAPHARDPRPRGDHDRLALQPALAGRDRLDAALAALEADDLHALADLRAGAARPVGEVAHGLHRVRPAAAALVQQRLHRRVPVGPRPGQVLAAALGADHELRRVPHPLVLRADGDQVVDLAPRHRRQVADLAEAVGLGVGLEHVDRQRDQLGDRLGAVVVAHDPARAARSPRRRRGPCRARRRRRRARPDARRPTAR